MNCAYRLLAACILVSSWMAAAPGEITGVAVDSETGKPISHVRVTATIRIDKSRQLRGDVLVALTDEDGHFRFSGLPVSVCEVRVDKAGYFADANNLQVVPGAGQDPLKFPLTQTGGLTVRVIDDSGSPVGGAQVAFLHRGEATPTSDWNTFSVAADGTYRLSMARGSYQVVAVSPGRGNLLRARGQTFLPTYYPGTTNADRGDWIDVVPGKEIQADVPIAPIPGRQIRGRLNFTGGLIQLTAFPSGSDNPNVTWGLTQVTPSAGEFRVSGLTPGTYVLNVSVCLERPCMYATVFRKAVPVIDADVDNLVITEADRLTGR